MTKKYRYSEIFGGHGYIKEDGSLEPGTIQGEGKYTGITSVWLRVWGCNLNCSGFGQTNPTDTKTYELPYQDIDVSKYSKLEDLPVFSKGCDSSYSWSQKFINLAHQETAEEIVNKLRQRLYKGKFVHEKSKEPCHFVITGGEPLLSQATIVAVLNEFEKQGEIPPYLTIETNGTLPIRDEFEKTLWKHLTAESYPFELFWSASPKIFATSGEAFETSIKPEILAQYNEFSKQGQLKFVCNGSEQSWNEIEQAIKLYRDVDVNWPVYIMPVGATIEGQKLLDADVADQAIYRGYNVSARVHVYLYGNELGR